MSSYSDDIGEHLLKKKKKMENERYLSIAGI